MKLASYVRLVVLAAMLSLAAPLMGQGSTANGSLLMSITGQKQGYLRGEVMQKGREGQHRLLAYTHEIVSSHDPATGLPTGKRQHQPFRIVKLLNESSPPLLTAMTTGESLTVIVDVWAIDAFGGGSEMKLMTYTLTNARVVSIRSWAPNRSDTAAQNYPPAEEVAFTYQKITVTFGPKSIESVDNWNDSTQ